MRQGAHGWCTGITLRDRMGTPVLWPPDSKSRLIGKDPDAGKDGKQKEKGLPPPSPYHPSGSSQCTSPEHPVSCIEPGLVIRFTYDNIHVSMPFSQIIPPLPSPTESKRLFYTSVSLLLSHIQGYHYHLSKFHIYVLL